MIAIWLTVWFLAVVGVAVYWIMTGLMLRRKVEFNAVEDEKRNWGAKRELELWKVQRENADLMNRIALNTSESIAKCLIEGIPKAIERTVDGILSAQRVDWKEKGEIMSNIEKEMADRRQNEEGDYDWWHAKDEDVEDPFDQYRNQGEQTEPFAPESTRPRIERKVTPNG